MSFYETQIQQTKMFCIKTDAFRLIDYAALLILNLPLLFAYAEKNNWNNRHPYFKRRIQHDYPGVDHELHWK